MVTRQHFRALEQHCGHEAAPSRQTATGPVTLTRAIQKSPVRFRSRRHARASHCVFSL